MFKSLRTIRGQGIVVQYAAVFFLVVAFVTAMSVFIRRAVQSRMLAAQDYSFKEINAVFENPDYEFAGNLWAQYEPYYLDSQVTQRSSQQVIKQITPAGRDGIMSYEMPHEENVSRFESRKDQFSPQHAD